MFPWAGNGIVRDSGSMAELTERFAEAFAYHQRGNLARARALYEELLAAQPNHFDALHLLGVISAQTRDFPRAVALISRAIEIDSRHALTYFNRGSALQELGQSSAALRDYDQAIALDPGFAPAHSNRGVVLHDLRRFDAALESCNKAVGLDPHFAEAQFNRANALKGLGQWQAALEGYDKAIALRPNYAEAHFNRGNLLRQRARWEAALASYDSAIAIRTNFAPAHANRAYVLAELERWEEALAGFDRAITIRADLAEAHLGRGNALKALKRLAEALSSYDRAISINPNLPEAFSNRGLALKELGQLDAALASCNRAITIDPKLAASYLNRGVVEKGCNQLESALQSYERAIELKADYAEAYSNRGVVLNELKRFEAALESYGRAIAIDSAHADAHYNRAVTLLELKQYAASIEGFNRAGALKSPSKYIEGLRLHAKMQVCDWRDLDSDLARLEAGIARGAPVSPPFPLLALTGSAQLQRQAAQIWVREECPPIRPLPQFPRRIRGDKIRVGYFSADFHVHATTQLIAELFETHDRSRFEITLFSFGPESNDAMRMRLRAAGNDFLDVRGQSDELIAQLARERRIDLAVDLKGFTKDGRTGIFARRAAPLQLNYLGYPGSMSADYIDYLIADRTLVPEEGRRHYAEKIVFLPDSYQPNAQRSIAAREFSRQELGLPPEGFVFCCFNNNYKIAPGTFSIWMNILKRIAGSVLWLLGDNPGAADNLRREALERGVRAERLIFAPRFSLEDHLARHRAADLFLDTLPYNAHTTASDALWADLPVLTCIGETFAGRVAASLLTAVGLPELIASSAAQYEQLAVELAMHPQRLADLKRKLAANRATAPLFNSGRYAKHLEAAYALIYERYQAGLPPDHLFVEPVA